MTEFKATPGVSSTTSNDNGDAKDETKWVSEGMMFIISMMNKEE